MMKRAEALRKCLIVFDALRRVSSKGNAGLEPIEGAEESFQTDSEICQVLREWLREMESGARQSRPEPDVPKVVELKEWQRLVENKPPERLDLMDDAVEVELEGSGATWWYVCSDCRREVSLLEKVCPSCRKRLRWEEIQPK